MLERARIEKTTDLKIWKQILFFVIGLFGLTVISLFIQIIVQLAARRAIVSDYDYQTFMGSTTFDMIVNGSTYLIIAVIFLILMKDDTNEFFKSFKDWKPYVAAAIGFSAILTFNLFYNLILNATGAVISDNANESSLNSIVSDFPFLSLLIFALIGPIVEEFTYRVGLFSLLKRVHISLAYVVTIIVFTFIHFDFQSNNMVNELLNIPFYMFAAATFCFLYHRFGLASSISAHVTNNLLSIGTAIIASFK